MCGRFSLALTPDEVRTLFDLPPLPASPDPALTDRARYNVAPTQPILAVVAGSDGGPVGRWLDWCFSPPGPRRPVLINARTETVFERGVFRAAVRNRRCIVPADGFFEWAKVGRTKQPYHVHPRDGGLWLFAGIWNPWREGRMGCAILTVPANDEVAALHDRMPLVLPREGWSAWLDPGRTTREDLEGLLRPGAEADLELVPVSKRVSSVDNDDPECVAPVTLQTDAKPDRRPARAEQLGFDW